MLELKNIVKDYVSGNNVTHALKGISVNFRKNEFVSILGASGCGKTTTLNIVGGLDRYTSGDLIINGKSTKDYTDRDWDTYRNHSIGFIFQSYNLIGHQNILKNVELTLTISGVGKKERTERAMEALKIVGLAGMEKKKPNQLSGGQCQRVAIARALINNPEIVLADEPTGALDSETSVQIMDLLKEVAKDRLVIMVTHNPDLAKNYSTRIITMSDGVLLKDTNPFDGKDKEKIKEVSKGKKKQTSMSLITSTGLSLANLGSKLKRTILVTIAGSIGIIGVSAVLAVSQGVKDFIKEMQDDMLSAYPIGIAEESVDYTSLMSGLDTSKSKEALEFDIKSEVGVDSMINFLMTAYSNITSVKTNTINQELIDFIDNLDEDAYGSIFKNYQIDPTNNIFTDWTHNLSESHKSDLVSLNGLTNSYIEELKTVKGFENYASYVNLFTSFMDELPGDEDYLLDQYELIDGGRFATKEDEMMLVVNNDTTLTDLLLAEMGYYAHDDFLNIAKYAIKKNELEEGERTPEAIADLKQKYNYKSKFSFEELTGKSFYYLPQELIVKDLTEKVTTNEQYVPIDYKAFAFMPSISINMFNLEYTENGLISGSHIGFDGTNPTYETVSFVRDDTSFVLSDNIVENVCGTWTGVSSTGKEVKLSFNSGTVSITYDETVLAPQPVLLQAKPRETTGYHYNSFVDDATTMLAKPEAMEMKITGILRLKNDRNFGSLKRGVYFTKAFADKYMNDANKADAPLTKAFKNHIKNYVVDPEQKGFDYYVTYDFLDHTKDDESAGRTHGEQHKGYASALNGDLSSSFSDLFSALTGVKYIETDKIHLRSICGEKVVEVKNDKNELTDITFEHLPKSVSIYPRDFESKEKVTSYLDKWNSDETLLINGKEIKANARDELSYTDTISVIIAVINTFIDAITIALVVFTSLSLVVSCFMIAVITYISVVERIKEIGIIRSLGGRKQNVASLFIMENLLTGLFSGGFGIGLTYVLQVILNAILKAKFHIVIANLTPVTALIMIGISILLSVLSGLIPSQSAAHKDPVVALRSNE